MRSATLIFLGLLVSIGCFAKVSVLESSESRMLVQYSLEDFEIALDGDFSSIVISGFGFDESIGSPLLPYNEYKLALPPSGSVSYTLLSSRSEKIALQKRLLPVPLMTERNGISQAGYQIDEALYRQQSSPPLEMLPMSVFRGYSYVPIRINPFAYDGQTTLTVMQSAIIQIDISG
ncbi:MAG: hypothetical protein U1C33_08235, partial [Candidatus Cloacimonadaceae bacterium]|nr:hypothetical protein [Candidatus Cloacimonadaceae bacterium]